MIDARDLYFPRRYPEGDWTTRFLPDVEDCWFRASDGVRLHAWYAPNPAASTHLIYLHGNAGSLSDRRDVVSRLWDLPANVLAVDYRGYGRSQGRPSEFGLYRDAEAAYDLLVKRRRVAPERIVFFGKSLGGAVAIEAARRLRCAGLIVQSAFTSGRDISRWKTNLLPLHWFVRNPFDALGRIGAVRVPKLVIHASGDEIIPFAMGRRLFEAAGEPKRFFNLGPIRHHDFMDVGYAYDAALRSFLAGCVREAARV